jgi:hypothetical protein
MVSQIQAEDGAFNERWLQYKKLPDAATSFNDIENNYKEVI